MPRVKKKRGKLSEIKEQRREARDEQFSNNAKRRKLAHDATGEDVETMADADADGPLYFEDTTPGGGVVDELPRPQNDDMVYYGLLDEDEQAYYTNINNKITADDFEDAEEKAAFIEAVYRESQGKELKLASSQACSRHLERLLVQSTAEQLRGFFNAVLEGLTQLVQHRFGSHVCETLFIQSAKHIPASGDDEEADEDTPSLTTLFLRASDQLKENIGYMLTDKFASHVMRVLLLVLSGEALDNPESKTMLASKRKENLAENQSPQATAVNRKVPKSFLRAMSSLSSAAVLSLDTTYLRALATHPTGNPVLQLLLRLELKHSDKGRALDEKSLFHRLVAPDTLEEEESEAAKFVSGLTYDPTGSRLIEVLVVEAPGKVFKKLYKGIWKDRMPNMAKNEIASFVAIKIIERLGKDELLAFRDSILPEVDLLLRRRRFTLIKTLIDRSVIRGLDLKALAQALDDVSAGDAAQFLQRLLYPTVDDEAPKDAKADLHGSLLAQSLLEVDALGGIIRKALSAKDSESLIGLGKDAIASRVLQLSLTAPATPLAYRKQIIPRLYGHVAELATSPVGSYLVDALWEATNGLHFMKERLANEMARHEAELRDSYTGRKVWRNWSMDLYARRRGEWQARAKGISETADTAETRKKTPIELARQRRADEKAKSQQASNSVVSASA
jgi:nucleolar protein 9